MAVTGTIATSVNVQNTTTTAGLSSINGGINSVNWSLPIADGTGAGAGNKVYHKERTLAGSSEDLDLSGVLTDVFGTTLSMTRIIAIGIRNISTTNTLTIGNATSNAWAGLLNATGTITLRPATAGGMSYFLATAADATAMVVTAGTGDLLKVAGTTGEKYQIFIVAS